MKTRFLIGAALVPLAAVAILFAQGATTTTSATAVEKVVTPSGLTIIKMAPGSGAQAGDTVRVKYTGKFVDGTKFDSSDDKPGKEPISFRLGAAQVIKGWEEGLTGMQVGEKRHLVVPPDLAYGQKGRDKIPPNTPLEFDVEMVGITRE